MVSKKRIRDADRLHSAEERYLVENGWVPFPVQGRHPIVPEGTTRWKDPLKKRVDLLPHAVALGLQKERDWNEKVRDGL